MKIKNSCRYVKLVPTSFRKTANNSYPHEKFTTYPIEFKFFGIIGEEVDAKVEEEAGEQIQFSQTVKNLCKTEHKYQVKIFKESTQCWETIYNFEGDLSIQEIQTHGLNFNLSAYNLDKIQSWMQNDITGTYNESITNSKIQASMIHKLRVEIEQPQGSSVWTISGVKIKPKALADIEQSNKGVFSHIPVKHLRS
jgi:hypothetical protein